MDELLIIKIAILVISVILHEIGHGYAALWLGDETAKRMGRLTLNPIPHIDIFMTIIIPFMLAQMGAPILGGAKPVPVNAQNFRGISPLKGMLIVAIAGPAVNLVLAAIAFLAAHMTSPGVEKIIIECVFYVFWINLVLLIFNLLPIPPLDGSRVLMGVVSVPMASRIAKLEPFGFFIILGLLAIGALRPVIMYPFIFFASFLPVHFIKALFY